jgi:predicted GNAT family acetyltransferase
MADAPDPAPAPVIADAPEASRYELRVGGELAGWVDYALRPGRIVAVHTEVLPAHQGRGHAGRLVRAVLDVARASGRTVTPVCPLFRDHFERHPEDLDLRAGPH